MDLVKGFACLVAVVFLELVTGLPEQQFSLVRGAVHGHGLVAGVQPQGTLHSVFGAGGVIHPKTCVNSEDWKTADNDKDGHPDISDNCPHDSNVDQKDDDGDGVGDACDTNGDRDGDGIPDGIDNCKDKDNHGQSDADFDGKGDACDVDADGDGITNSIDNCYLVPNSNQNDTNNDGKGDACQGDRDGDCVPDNLDICPDDPRIHTADFTNFHIRSLDKEPDGQSQANFKVEHHGTTVTQTLNSKPALMYGEHKLTDLSFTGTFYVNDDKNDNDFIGFIFGYQDTKNFYVVMWKRSFETSFECTRNISAAARVQLKRVHSKTGPNCALQDALWSNTNTPNQASVLWHSDNDIGWEMNTEYHWELTHRPNQDGLISFKIFTGKSPSTGLIVDSGNIFDSHIKGGYIGVYSHSQEDITWKNLHYKCDNGTHRPTPRPTHRPIHRPTHRRNRPRNRPNVNFRHGQRPLSLT